MNKSSYLLIIQPLIASYRKNLYDELSTHFDKVDIYSNTNISNGFKANVKGKFNSIHTPFIGKREKIYYQTGIVSSIIKNKPTAIYLTADFRALHFWILLFLSKLLQIPIFSHGQGLYDKPSAGIMQKLMFRVTTALSSAYICYTPSVKDSLIDIGIKPDNLFVMDNTIVNNFVVKPEDKKPLNHRLFYVGRLREGCNLELLFEAMLILGKNGKSIGLDIVGDGAQKSYLEKLVEDLKLDVTFFGAVYDDKKISDLSKKCTIAVYPGDAGLSIVHYMSLSLVPIVHQELTKHMGPEPSYIHNTVNGLTFYRNNSSNLAQVIEKLLDDQELIKRISFAAFETYISLSHPTMADKLIEVMNPYLEENLK